MCPWRVANGFDRSDEDFARAEDFLEFVHDIDRSGLLPNPELALELEQKGYSWTEGELAGAKR